MQRFELLNSERVKLAAANSVESRLGVGREVRRGWDARNVPEKAGNAWSPHTENLSDYSKWSDPSGSLTFLKGEGT